ncbi:carbohydrate-binding family 9-like protein [Sphingobacterium sp. lm-10]|uniref:carbohydrate-binding family 9-like protein n=1 Tax=Sphingobacterium sp. lm-10 TaxID=2944904 RepID=UPI0020217CD6|nr:carbohydrate-binding family 9-like protein [Sphingobacterium sp. lm-10]MCL7989133.1 carbohydrate-binding family 9-like protein [Sphingobacterium sp. lm-10]
MNLLKRFFPCLICVTAVHAQSSIDEVERLQSTPLVYQVQKIDGAIAIDGRDSEVQWSGIPWSTAFIDIEGADKPAPAYNTKFKMMYDDAHLYIYAKLEEPHVWGNITKYDDIIYHNNDFEVFIKPDIHHDHYYELEVNALNTIFDLAMVKPYRYGGKALIHWDMKGLKSAVHTEGTLNDSSDEDQFWSIEMAIPFSALHSFGSGNTPSLSSYWLFNFSRVQWQHSVVADTYERKSENGKVLPEDNWVWSPIGLVNMHYPERWGYIQFVDTLGNAALPSSHEIKKLGWNIHYLQQIHNREKRGYASQIDQLPGYAQYIAPSLDQFTLTYDLAADQAGYALRINDLKNNAIFRIDHLGNNTYYE